MANESLAVEEPVSADQPFSGVLSIAGIFAAIVLAALLGYLAGARQIARPGENSPEVGFARDMMFHHAQAVEMALLLRDRTGDPEMSQLALDILLTQQAQIGQMQGWLAAWGYPIARTGPMMAWMGMPTDGLMPGMATPEQMNELRSLEGVEADALFLQLMIVHHASGVDMGQAAVDLSERPEVRALAQSIVNAQVSEINYMQSLLEKKGYPPVPLDGIMDAHAADGHSEDSHSNEDH